MKTAGDKDNAVPAGVPSGGLFLRAKSTATALNLISEAVSQDKPVTVVTGQKGAGTSRLIQEWQLEQNDSTHVTYIAQPEAQPDDVMLQVANAYGLEQTDQKRTVIVSEFRKHLLDQANADIVSVLVLDHADRLSVEAVELFKMLASAKQKKKTLLRVILVGRPSLLEALRVAERPSDASRIAFVSVPPFEAVDCMALFSSAISEQFGKTIEVDASVGDEVYSATQGLPGEIVALAAHLHEELEGKAPEVVTVDHIVGLEGAAADKAAPATDINDIQDASKLPRSIRDSDDPQALLRFALSNRAKTSEPSPSQTAAPEPKPVSAKPETKPRQPDQPVAIPEDMPEDLSSALAQLADAERETVEKGGKVQALPPQRQEGRPPPMKLEGPIGGAARTGADAKKAAPVQSKAAETAPTSQSSDQFEFRGPDAAPKRAPIKATDVAQDALPEPKPRPKGRKSKERAVSVKSAARAAGVSGTEGEPSKAEAKDAAVYDQSKLREVLRSFDQEPEPEPKRRSYVPVMAGAAAVAAMVAAYPYVLGPEGVMPLGGDNVQTLGVPAPSLPRDPDGAAALPDPSVLASWEQKKKLEIARVQGPGPATSIAILTQPRVLSTPVQDIEAAARPDPVRLSARSAKPDIRPARVNALQSGDASSLASSIALQTTDSELANTMRLKEVAEREISSLIAELSGLRGDVKALRSEKTELEEGMTGARTQLAELEAEISTKTAALEAEQAELDVALAKRATVGADLEQQTAALNTAQETVASLQEQDAALTSRLDETRTQVGELETRLTSQQEEMAALSADIEAGRQEQSELAGLLEQGRIELSALDQQTDARIATLSDLQDTLKLARSERDEIAAAQADLATQSENAQNRLSVVTASLLAAQSALADAETDKASLRATLDQDTRAATQALAKLTDKNQELGAEIARLEGEIQTAQTVRDAAQTDAEALRSERQTLAQNVDLARAEAQEYENRRSAAEQQLAGLLPQVENAQNALSQSQQELQDRAATVDAELSDALAQLTRVSAQKESIEAELAALETRVNTSSEARDRVDQELAALTGQRDAVAAQKDTFELELAEAQEALAASNSALAAAKSDRANTLAQLTRDSDAASERLETLQAQNAQLIRQTVDLTAQIETAGAQKARVGAEIAALQAESEELVAGLDQTRIATAQLAETRNQSAEQLAAIKQSIQSAQDEQKAAEKAASLRLAAISSETEALLQTKDVVTADIALLTDQAKDAAEKELLANEALGDLKAAIVQTRGDAKQAELDLAALQTELRTARSDLGVLRDEAGQVETEIADLRNLQDSEAVRLNELKESVEVARQNAEVAAELTRLASLQTEARELAQVETLDEESVAEIASRFGDDAREQQFARQPSVLSALAVAIERPEIGATAPPPPPALRTRQADVVTAALARAPGLAKLSGQERDALRAELINGTCIPDALRKITGTINRQTLRALIRRMNRCTS